MFGCVGSALVGSIMRTYVVLKRDDDLKIMFNKIMLRPNLGDNPGTGYWGFLCPF